jgi:Tfp pilus assembly protein PilO
MHELNNNHDHLIMSKKTLSHIVSFLLLVGFLIFMIGYLLGKRKAMQEFSEIHKQNLFGEHVLQAFADMQPVQQGPSAPEVVRDANYESQGNVFGKFYAQLVSFGTLNGAQEVVNRLQRNGINTTIIKHKATVPHAKGAKVVHWYQVVTDSYSSPEELQSVVAGIKKIVKLHDIRIVKVDNGCNS